MKLQSSNTSEPEKKLAIANSPKLSEPTFGQKLADKLASKVGSWSFLIGQTTVLVAWVGCNLTPGLPHWDESPFILLNLVFSFASAYTAPVVLMSQNRQSDEDRAHAQQHYQMNLQTAQNLELLHQKMDQMYSEKLSELTELIQQQREARVLFTPKQTGTELKEDSNMVVQSVVPVPGYFGLLPHNIAEAKESFYVLPVEEVALSQQNPDAGESSNRVMHDQN
ncbi:DUF1003 domain-containing protein [Leptolyngbya sp. NK1-12]|uniref:DUF1003 domain-containing protein n=1 Tax=Leptolyngbya sp. NK1-12 TaxID=2547451 RepID=A0AA96WJC6_9CYAN|nr:DUF1003 domain-containing protein [Leptolyngbya sp. NK1-12]WNZ27007.1 DUF1003 domain-containing protein [Leptolyngbya sp. NK1-12]